MFVCPLCSRQFEVAGRCPFDQSILTPLLSQSPPTVADRMQPHDVTRKSTTQGHVPAAPSIDVVQSAYVAPAAPIRRPALGPTGDAQSTHSFTAMPSSEALVGKTLDGRYFIERKIGEGGMGIVFAARHAVIERPLAIKVLRAEVMRDSATMKRFEQEAKAASRIGHPNIVDVTDFGVTPDGMAYFVMEYIDGVTLAHTVRNFSPLPLRRVFRIAAQLARALGAAHDKGIAHRDLKPDNIFLIARDGREDIVKVVDFGIAKVQNLDGSNSGAPRLTKVGSIFGTPEFMAPEQATGRSDTDGRVDIYALGVMMYEMITGKLPHKGESTVRTISMQILDAPIPPRQLRPDLQIPEELELIVLKALAKKREQRFQTMGELNAALDVVARQVLGAPSGVSASGTAGYEVSDFSGDAIPNPAPVHFAHQADAHRPAKPSNTPPLRARPPTNQDRPPRSKQPSNGYRNPNQEPEFMSGDKPATFEHVFEEEAPLPRRSKLPLFAVGALVIGGIAGALTLTWKSQRDHQKNVQTTTVDAAVVAVTIPDAIATVAVAEPDKIAAARIETPSAEIKNHAPPPLSPHRVIKPNDPIVDIKRPPINIVEPPPIYRAQRIQILTKPQGGTIYMGDTYRGSDGLNMEEPTGTKATIRCTMQGYKPGTVELVFDGKTDGVLCVMQRIKICINGIKNPFDDCELPAGAGSAAIGSNKD
jgi:serine/threonine protein kinase